MPQAQKITCRVPSNIAFVKYWGKRDRQIPMNPSLSMTLSKCYTEMEVSYTVHEEASEKSVASFSFEGGKNELFEKKIEKYLSSVTDIYPLAEKITLDIKSKNTFPHSAGIASSASAMGALAFVLTHIEKETGQLNQDFDQRASELARLASGSACRSLFPAYASWGHNAITDTGSNHFADPVLEVHDHFKNVCDSVLIVSRDIKTVSSSAGHALMNGHPYREGRISQSLEHYRIISNAIKLGDWDSFGEVLENEALSLHGLMMSSTPSYILLTPASIELIDMIRAARLEHNLKMYFTIDAGPNIHLIYPKSDEIKVKEFIDSKLSPICEDIIHDEVGSGPEIV